LFGLVRIRAEAAQFGPGRGAPGTDLETPAGKNIKHSSAFGDFDWMIEFGHTYHDAVSDAHLLGNHRTRGKEQLRGRAMRILFQKMVLDGPNRIESEFIRELHLLQAAVVNDFFRITSPRTRDRNFVKNTELHGYTSNGMALTFNTARLAQSGDERKSCFWTVGQQLSRSAASWWQG